MVISKAMRTKIDVEIAKYPVRRGALLPALHRIQEELGYVSRETAIELAELLGLHPVQVMDVVTFYNMFYGEPQGRHHVHVCTNLSCSLRGARTLLRGLEGHLRVRAGETTADGRVTLGHEECLGACGYAPMLRIDATYHEDLDFEEAKRLIDALE
jgi:NADH-quinone oxidoreductase E subunit